MLNATLKGNQCVLFDTIVDFRRSATALSKEDQIVAKADGRTFLRRSTKGWQLCVQWKDGSTSWEKFSDMKESHPIEVAEYAISQDIADDPAFIW